ncbi:MAG: pyridoxamine 5'-phosphate oxidase family protein [Deltaproteobacteria bacterium]|nr:pyridoxamine 5'-phosphate oxidase family protein [Deltaproteobacteria bacterium]
MAFSFHINTAEKFVDIQAKGAADFDTLAGLTNRLIEQADYEPDYGIMVDFSAVRYVPSFGEIRHFGKLFQTVSSAFRGKVAFVVGDAAQLRAGQFASVIARTLKFKMNVFGERRLALNWIQDKQELIMDSLQTKIMDVIAPFQLASLATIQPDGMPWVRYVTAQADENMTIRFATPRHSRKVAHIEANPNVHLTCGCTDLATANAWVQIIGRATVTADSATKKAFWKDFLNAYFTGPNDEEYAVVEVIPTKIEYYTMSSLTPEVLHLQAEATAKK